MYIFCLKRPAKPGTPPPFLIVSPPHTTLSCWDIIRTPIRLPCLVSTRIKRLAGSAISRQIICDIYDLAVRFLDCVPHCTLLLLLLALALALVFMMLLALVLVFLLVLVFMMLLLLLRVLVLVIVLVLMRVRVRVRAFLTSFLSFLKN